MLKKLILFLLLLSVAFPVYAEEKQSGLSVSGNVTYGSYSNSIQRDTITLETLNLSYIPSAEYGAGLTLANSVLERKATLDNINGTNVGGTYFWTPKLSGGGYLGGKISLLHVNSDDANSDNTNIPFIALIYKSANLKQYLELGYAHTAYDDSTARQYTFTGGFSLFNDWVWSQTRLCYIDLSKKVFNKSNTFSVEERLTYFVIPKKLYLSLYGMLGEKIYAYDPDLNASYNLPDVLNGSAGFSANYNFTKTFAAFADITYESYKNELISDSYGVTYSTVGIRFNF